MSEALRCDEQMRDMRTTKREGSVSELSPSHSNVSTQSLLIEVQVTHFFMAGVDLTAADAVVLLLTACVDDVARIGGDDATPCA